MTIRRNQPIHSPMVSIVPKQLQLVPQQMWEGGQGRQYLTSLPMVEAGGHCICRKLALTVYDSKHHKERIELIDKVMSSEIDLRTYSGSTHVRSGLRYNIPYRCQTGFGAVSPFLFPFAIEYNTVFTVQDRRRHLWETTMPVRLDAPKWLLCRSKMRVKQSANCKICY